MPSARLLTNYEQNARLFQCFKDKTPNKGVRDEKHSNWKNVIETSTQNTCSQSVLFFDALELKSKISLTPPFFFSLEGPISFLSLSVVAHVTKLSGLMRTFTRTICYHQVIY